MRILIIIICLFISYFGLAQLPDNLSLNPGVPQTTITHGSGMIFFDGPPNFTPDEDCCAEMAVNTRTRQVYMWDRVNDDWEYIFRPLTGAGVPNAAPADTLLKSYVDINTGKWYYHTGGTNWVEQGSGGGGGGGSANVNTIVTLADTATIISPAEGDIASDCGTFIAFWTGSNWCVVESSGGAFDSNRNILRTYTVGTNIGGSTIADVINWMYFTPPTISISTSPTNRIVRVGTSTSFTISGNVSNSGGATLSNGVVQKTSPLPVSNLNTFGSGTSYNQGITFTPQQGGSTIYDQLTYSFRANQDWTGSGESGNAQSGTVTLTSVYPILYGTSTLDLRSTGDPYTILSKLDETEGDKTVNISGSGFVYFGMPNDGSSASWSDVNLSAITFNGVTPLLSAFTPFTTTVSSSGLTNNWSNVSYTIYKLNNTTIASGDNYTFEQ